MGFFKYSRQEQRPSTSSTASDSAPAQYLCFPPPAVTISASSTSESGTQALPPPTIITSSVTPPATSPTVPTTTATTPTHPLLATRRDSTTQCGRLGRMWCYQMQTHITIVTNSVTVSNLKYSQVIFMVRLIHWFQQHCKEFSMLWTVWQFVAC